MQDKSSKLQTYLNSTDLSKVLERILHNLIFKHLCSILPISTRQYRFLSGRSIVSALLTLPNDVLDSLDKGQEITSVFFDLSKAFDSVHHAPLLRTLTRYPDLIQSLT